MVLLRVMLLMLSENKIMSLANTIVGDGAIFRGSQNKNGNIYRS